MADTIRLNKVLRELNISIDRVADFLDSKGHIIEKRPTTKISKDLYSLLCDEFQIDADKKIASKEVVEAKNKEKEEIREKQERQQQDSIKPRSEIIKASSKVVKFKKLGKIDLEPKKEAEQVQNMCWMVGWKTGCRQSTATVLSHRAKPSSKSTNRSRSRISTPRSGCSICTIRNIGTVSMKRGDKNQMKFLLL